MTIFYSYGIDVDGNIISEYIGPTPDHSKFVSEVQLDASKVKIVNDQVVPKSVEPTEEELILVARYSKRSKINAERNLREQSGFQYSGKILESDTISYQRMVGAVITAISIGDSFNIEWICLDNTTISLNKQTMVEMFLTYFNYVAQLHSHATSLKEQLVQLTTLDEINNLPNW